MEENQVKILFRFFSDILDEEMVETMWAVVVDREKGYYRLDNVPFYVTSVASGDIVFAEYDDSESRLTYRKTVQYSGNSTIHIMIMGDDVTIGDIRQLFKEFGCESEQVNDKYFAMEIPHNLNYIPIKAKLVKLEKNGVIGFKESCLSSNHQ